MTESVRRIKVNATYCTGGGAGSEYTPLTYLNLIDNSIEFHDTIPANTIVTVDVASDRYAILCDGVNKFYQLPPQKAPIEKDNINPDHYKVGGIETWDYLKAKMSAEALKGFALGNILKYVSRAEHKNKVEDLKKAKWYLDKIILEMEKDIQGDAVSGINQ